MGMEDDESLTMNGRRKRSIQKLENAQKRLELGDKDMIKDFDLDRAITQTERALNHLKKIKKVK